MNKRPIRIANCSGFFGDRMSALAEVVNGGPVDVVTGDYLAEVTMTILAKQRKKNPELGFVPTFLGQLPAAMPAIVEKGIKVVVNAGGLNPVGLATTIRNAAEKFGLKPKVASISGDDISARIDELRAANRDFASLETGAGLPSSADFVTTANAYLGAWGIVRALEEGADIVICPRVTDASLVVGAAAWWHGWKRDDWDFLAGAVAAGHVIECGPQATGGNYSGFGSIAKMIHPGFPLAEIAADGSSVITKHPDTAGAVTVGTVTAQLVYEISGPRYLNPDVVTRLDTAALEEVGPDQVAIRGVKGEPPPPTTKVAVTTKGSFRNELTLVFVGLDIDAKIALVESALAGSKAKLQFQRIGTAAPNAESQEAASVLLRIIATGDDEKEVGRAFSSALIEQGLSSYPGLFATSIPGAAHEVAGYWPTLVQQSSLSHEVVHHDGRTEVIPLPPAMAAPTADEPVDGTAAAPATDTEIHPLGRLVDARSGDKGSSANVGLWVKTDAAYAWLRGELTTARFRELMPEAANLKVDRYELPNLRAINFVIHELMPGGAIATSRFDRQAKALGEFLRQRHVAIPKSLL